MIEGTVRLEEFVARRWKDEGLFYDNIPKASQELIKEAAVGLLTSPGKIIVIGFPGVGKTYLLEQLVVNIDRFVEMLPNHRTPIFINMNHILWGTLGHINEGFPRLVKSLKEMYRCSAKDLVFITEVPPVAEAMATVEPEVKIILEVNVSTYLSILAAEQAGATKNWGSWMTIDANDVILPKAQLVGALYNSANAELEEFGHSISKKEITSILTFFMNNAKELSVSSGAKKGQSLLPPGAWMPAIRSYMGWKIFKDEAFILPSERFNTSKAIKSAFKKHSHEMVELLSIQNRTFFSKEIPKDLEEAMLVALGAEPKKEKKPSLEEINFVTPKALEEALSLEVLGQDDAINEVVEGMMIPFAGLHDREKPLRSFLFLGPTGVGKTKLALTLAKSMATEPFEVLRLDMSEFSHSHEVAKLFGAPPGYVGSGEGGILTNALKENPRTLVLLDEIEKAHPKVYEQFLQVLDAGRMTSGDGETVSFTEAVIVMTSNLGAKDLAKRELGFTNLSENEMYHERQERASSIVNSAVEKWFTPEFINRLDHKIVFNELSQEIISAIVEKELGILATRMEGRMTLTQPSNDILTWVLERSSTSKYGAREIKRVISRGVGTPIAKFILEEKQAKALELLVNDDKIVVKGV